MQGGVNGCEWWRVESIGVGWGGAREGRDKGVEPVRVGIMGGVEPRGVESRSEARIWRHATGVVLACRGAGVEGKRSGIKPKTCCLRHS